MAKRLLQAKHYQRLDAPVRLLAQHAKPGIRNDIHGALTHVGDMFDKEKALYWLHSRVYTAVSTAVQWQHFREILKAPFDRIARLREAAAHLGVRKVNGSFAARHRAVRFKKMGLQSVEPQADIVVGRNLDNLFDLDAIRKASIGERFNFDRFAPGTLDRVRADQDRLIQQLTEDARTTIDSIVIAGVRAGLSPQDIVDDVRDMVGLTDTQAMAVMNYRRMLEALDSGALQRQLRNTDLDQQVRDAIDGGADLDTALIDRATSDYEDNYLEYRAATIAQTESVRAANAGLHDAYSQAIDRGALPSESVTRHWQIALDERTCPICLSIPDLNPDGVGVDEPFDSDDGAVDDPPIHPNCRCSIEYVTDLDKVPDEEG